MSNFSEAIATTHLIHRGERGDVSWWRTCAICDMPGSFGKRSLRDLRDVLPQIKKIGFDGILFRLSDPDVVSLSEAVQETVDLAHNEGLRVLVRVMAQPDDKQLDAADSPPFVRLSDDPKLVASRSRELMKLGIDGIDLGRIEDAPEIPDAEERLTHFTNLVNLQLAEMADIGSNVILTAEALQHNHRFYDTHVTEDWFHHLRDDALFGAPWSASIIQDRVKKSYAVHDPLGQAVAWKPSLGGTWSSSPKLRSFEPGSWEEGARSVRADAVTVYAASLPGAIYIPFRRCGGSVRVTPKDHLRIAMGSKPIDTMRRGLMSSALRLRHKYNLATTNLAFIEGMSWSQTGTAVQITGRILTVLNTSDKPIEVPSIHIPLLYSGGYLDESAAGSIVEPQTCAWFMTGQPKPVDPGERRSHRG